MPKANSALNAIRAATAAASAMAVGTVPSTRSHYIQECRDNIKKFKSDHSSHWIEYIRSNRPDDYQELVGLKSWVRDIALHPEYIVRRRCHLVRRLVDEKLHACRRPLGVAVAAVHPYRRPPHSQSPIPGLFLSYSLCNFASGDRWSRPIALWKAMKRIEELEIEPCPTVKVIVENDTPSLAFRTRSTGNLARWMAQFPMSSRKTVVRLTRRIFEQYITDDSVLIADLLPVIV